MANAAVPLLSVESLNVRFGGIEAVRNVSFAVQAGERVGLVGPNGAGKTTTFNAITAQTKVSAGRILFGGQNITGQTPYRVARIGMRRTFQNVQLFDGLSVRENVILGAGANDSIGVLAAVLQTPGHRVRERRACALADHWLACFGLSAYADRPAVSLPLGLQRVCEVARALAGEPRLLLLDEPAAGLNKEEKSRLKYLLDKAVSETGCSLILVDHDVGLVMDFAHRVVVVDRGVVIADDAPELVRANPAVIAAYLGEEAEVHDGDDQDGNA